MFKNYDRYDDPEYEVVLPINSLILQWFTLGSPCVCVWEQKVIGACNLYEDLTVCFVSNDLYNSLLLMLIANKFEAVSLHIM